MEDNSWLSCHTNMRYGAQVTWRLTHPCRLQATAPTQAYSRYSGYSPVQRVHHC